MGWAKLAVSLWVLALLADCFVTPPRRTKLLVRHRRQASHSARRAENALGSIIEIDSILNHVNNQITAPELRVVDEQGQNLGVLPREKALEVARERGLDLIEIAPQAKPPVARIMSFDKFRYQKDKELKKQRRAQKGPELKQIRISARAAKNDLEIKARKVNEFLDAGHKVEIMMVLRGRHKGMQDWAKERMKEFLTIVGPNHKVFVEPKPGGKGLIMQIGR